MEITITGWWFFALPLWKIMELKSVGMITFPAYGKIEAMFQTTNQITLLYHSQFTTYFNHHYSCWNNKPLEARPLKNATVWPILASQPVSICLWFSSQKSEPMPINANKKVLVYLPNLQNWVIFYYRVNVGVHIPAPLHFAFGMNWSGWWFQASWKVGRIIPYIMENKKCLKPPTRYYAIVYVNMYITMWGPPSIAFSWCK